MFRSTRSCIRDRNCVCALVWCQAVGLSRGELLRRFLSFLPPFRFESTEGRMLFRVDQVDCFHRQLCEGVGPSYRPAKSFGVARVHAAMAPAAAHVSR